MGPMSPLLRALIHTQVSGREYGKICRVGQCFFSLFTRSCLLFSRTSEEKIAQTGQWVAAINGFAKQISFWELKFFKIYFGFDCF